MGKVFMEGSSATLATDPVASAGAIANAVDAFEKLLDLVTNQSLQAVTAVAAGGSGYAVGDKLRIADSAATEAFPASFAGKNPYAIVEVMSVSSGAVTAVRVRNGGSYATLPTAASGSDYATTAITGSGTGCQLTSTFANVGWTILRQTVTLTGVAIDTAGSGYGAGNVVTVVGGDTRVGYSTPQTSTPATVTIDTVGGSGEATSVSVTTAGVYHRTPGTNAVPVTGGAGTGLLLDLTFSVPTSDSIQREAWLQSPVGDAIVGIRTFTDGAGVTNWEIAAAPTYTAGNNWESQVQISPGRYPDAETGSYVVLRTTTVPWFARVTDRAIRVVFNIDTGVYTNTYLGLLNAYATTTEFPYPALAMGCSSRRDTTVASAENSFMGMNAAVAVGAADLNGPGSAYKPGGGWEQVKNGHLSGSDVVGDEDRIHVIPGGWFDSDDSSLQTADRIAPSQKNDWESFASVATATGAAGADAPTDEFVPQDSSENGLPLFECVVMGVEPVNQVFGELEDIRWLHRALNTGVLSAESEINVGDELWVVFNNCRSTDNQHWFAMKATP